MYIISNLESIVGIKSIFSAPLVSSHLPYILLAAANTEHLVLRVVVKPAYKWDDRAQPTYNVSAKAKDNIFGYKMHEMES